MSNYLGNYSLYIALIASVYLMFKSYLDANSENKYLDKKLYFNYFNTNYNDYGKFF